MAFIEVQPKASLDMTWYTGSALGPLEVAENLVACFGSEESMTLGELSANSGMPEDDILGLLPLMLRHGLFEPLDKDSAKLRLNPETRGSVVLRLGAAARRLLAGSAARP